MKPTIPTAVGSLHGVLPAHAPRMAKATLPDVRIPAVDWLRAIGAALQRAVNYAGLSNKEAAAACGVNDGEFGKWISGTEGRRPQFDRVFAVAALRRPLVIALAELGGDGVEVVTEIRVTRDVALSA